MQSKAKLSSLWADWQRRKREERRGRARYQNISRATKIWRFIRVQSSSRTAALSSSSDELSGISRYTKCYTYIFSTHQSNLVTAADFSRRMAEGKFMWGNIELIKVRFTELCLHNTTEMEYNIKLCFNLWKSEEYLCFVTWKWTFLHNFKP